MYQNSTKYTLSSQWKDRIWTPDTFFRNAIGGGIANVMSPSLYFTVTETTNVFMAARLQMKLSCDMNFKKYPFDYQTCYIRISTCEQKISIQVITNHLFVCLIKKLLIFSVRNNRYGFIEMDIVSDRKSRRIT